MENYGSSAETGHLRVGVFTNGQAQPVEGAHIYVRPRGEEEILDDLITDASGQTLNTNLPAPPVELSLVTGLPRPYSEYDLTISAEGYEDVEIDGVQILPGTTALQEVELVSQVTGAPETQLISIQDNTLYGVFPPKIPESEVKPLPPSLGYIVLPEPVVPEFIVVHDGRPENAAAPNYWVPFTDYIKNVASCEIYATWPRAALEANVLAIISFTLNRVYTEWYRSRGFDFTITSSTAFDHAYSHGRNIFTEISQVVDNIFTSYVTRPNIRQPLFTQYCDGRRTQCPNWMTQWGSKSLADQGYASMDILKSFYGYDIYLMQARTVAGVPSSFPGQNLQRGSTGADVRTIQTQLNAIAKNYPAIPVVQVDGIFGEDTLAAVTQFQNIFDLNATGIVDFSTWYAISRIYVAVTRMAELV